MTNISHLLNTPEEREWDSYKGRVEARAKVSLDTTKAPEVPLIEESA